MRSLVVTLRPLSWTLLHAAGLVLPDIGIGKRWRGWLWTRIGSGTRRAVKISRTAVLHEPWNVVWGDNIYIAEGVVITSGSTVTIEDGVLIAPYAVVTTCNHIRDDHGFSSQVKSSPVHLSQRSWIGTHAVVLPGAVVGAGTALAAQSVARGSLLSHTLYAGQPAMAKRSYHPDLTSAVKSEHHNANLHTLHHPLAA